MSLIDTIETAVGPAALEQIGNRAGLSPEQLHRAITTLAPMLGPKLAQHAAASGLGEATDAAAPPEPGSDGATIHGNSVLAAIFGSQDASRTVAEGAAAQSGVAAHQIEAVLPQLASLAVTALSSGHNGGSRGILLGDLASVFGKQFRL